MRGGASVVAQAPTAKRALERFVHEMHSLFLQAGEPPEAITVGFLKHRDIEGNTMPSQVRPLHAMHDDYGMTGNSGVVLSSTVQRQYQEPRWCSACLSISLQMLCASSR